MCLCVTRLFVQNGVYQVLKVVWGGGRTSNFFFLVGGACLVCKHVAGLLGQRIGPSQDRHLHRAAQK